MCVDTLKGVQLAVRGMKSIDLRNETIEILVSCFSYNSTIKREYNFLQIVSNIMQTVFKLLILLTLNSRNLVLNGRTDISKSLAIWKIICRALIAPVPTHIIKPFEKIQTFFLWNNINSKIELKTIWKNFGEGLQSFDIRSKLTSLQISKEKKLCDDFFHEWKEIISFKCALTYLHVRYPLLSCLLYIFERLNSKNSS